MSIAAQSIGYEAALKHHYRGVRARLTPPPVRIVPAPEPEAAPTERPVAEPIVLVSDTLNMLDYPGWRFILHYVARKHYLAPRDLTGRLRFRNYVRARDEAIWLIHKHCSRAGMQLSLPDIGRRFGRDHTTILHSLRNHEKRLRQAKNSVSPAFNTQPPGNAEISA